MSPTTKDEVKENTNQFKESRDRYLEQQRQQGKDTTSNISQTTEEINESLNKFQDDNRRNVEKNADTFNKYQEQVSIATHVATQKISINTIELQKNICNTVHSSYLQFLDNISKSSENFKTPEKWYELFNPFNIQKYIVNLPNSQNFIDQSTVSSSMREISQRFVENINNYSELVQNIFNLARKTERPHITTYNNR